MTVAPTGQYDVIIVGAGVAGALVGWKLAQAGRRVLILEAGEEGRSRAELVEEFAAASIKSLGSPYVASEPAKIPGPEQYSGTQKSRPVSVRDDYYDQNGKDKYLSTYERRVGGTTWHWLGHTPRLLPNDFNLSSLYGVGVDWPLSYADIEPWYCEAEKALGVAGDDTQWTNVHGAFRSQLFPMPPIWTSFCDDYITQKVDGRTILGVPVHILATPAARNSLPYDDRPPCAGNASCIPICPIGAKYDASVHVEKARKAGATLKPRCVVTKLHVERDGAVRRVTYRPWNGSEQTVSGKLVIIAANAIETPKLLLLSAGDGAPRGVANSSDQVGRNLMDHLQKSVFAKLPDPVYPFRGPPSTAGIEVFRDGPFRRQVGALRISLDNDGWASRGSPYADADQYVQQGLFGADLQRSLREAVIRQIRISCSTEVLPDPNNRVTPSDLLDTSGIPRPRITFAAAKYTLDALDKALDAINEILSVAGGTACAISPIGGAGHIMGTCRMGTDSAMAVVDAYGRSFDHKNLFIVGSSTFPTCGTANPTLTIAALVLRTADHILQAGS
jgi:choline dehydrogenase-like flavoprotein